MAKKAKKPTYTKNPGLSQAPAPTLIKQNGERIVAQTELQQLQDKREDLRRQMEKIDTDILALKTKRKEELLAELQELGLDVPQVRASSAEGGKKKGRPKGVPMSEAHKQALRDGRAKAKAKREAEGAPAS